MYRYSILYIIIIIIIVNRTIFSTTVHREVIRGGDMRRK